MAGKMRKYYTIRAAFLAENPFCGVCHSSKATEIHHKQGRGVNLLATATWVGVCSTCHRFIHLNVSWAYGEGLLLKNWAGSSPKK